MLSLRVYKKNRNKTTKGIKNKETVHIMNMKQVLHNSVALSP